MVKQHCCTRMAQHIHQIFEKHINHFECPEKCILYEDKWNEYGIIHDGGQSYLKISYCPWCGKKLPKSKLDLWFDTLIDMGYDDPFSQDIPDKYKTNEWYAWHKNSIIYKLFKFSKKD